MGSGTVDHAAGVPSPPETTSGPQEARHTGLFAALVGDSRLVLRALQRSAGNQAVVRLLTGAPPVTVVEGSPVPGRFGAVGAAQGDTVHLGPSAPSLTSPAGQALLGHELAHVAQQRAGRVRPTSEFAGTPVNTDRGLESDAHASAAAALALPVRPGAGSDAGSGVMQLWPPNSIEEAEIELEELDAQLFDRGFRIVAPSVHGTRRAGNVELELTSKLTQKALREEVRALLDRGATIELGDADEDPAVIVAALDHYIALLAWKHSEQSKPRVFGHRSVPTVAYQAPSPFQTTWSFNPADPERAGQPLEETGDDVVEDIGGDLFVRLMDEKTLDDLRADSRAYRKSGAKPRTSTSRRSPRTSMRTSPRSSHRRTSTSGGVRSEAARLTPARPEGRSGRPSGR
jgi:hypothetical protein